MISRLQTIDPKPAVAEILVITPMFNLFSHLTVSIADEGSVSGHEH